MRRTSMPRMAPRERLRPVVLLPFMASMSSSGRHHVADLATPCLASARSDLSPPLMHPPTLGCSNYSRHNCAFLQLDPSPLIDAITLECARMDGTSILFAFQDCACISRFAKQIPSLSTSPTNLQSFSEPVNLSACKCPNI